MVAGLTNQKNSHQNPETQIILNDIDFVSYELIQPRMKPSEQLQYLQSLNIKVVGYTNEEYISNEYLSNLLLLFRNTSKYIIDGLIITNDCIYNIKQGNPDHAFAFKMVLTEQKAEAKVLNVLWTPSKDGYLKPRVHIETINICGVNIEYATGFNADFIVKNKIGPGALIEIIRSGDVIPHITKVLIPADGPLMPSIKYIWNESRIDILLEDKDDNLIVREKNITNFFKEIGVDGLSSGNIKLLINAGFDDIIKIVFMEISDYLQIKGIKEKTASKFYNGIKQKLDEASLITLMSASGVFGRGFNIKKIELIMNYYPTILNDNLTNSAKLEKLVSLKGLGEKTSQLFIESIPKFIEFINLLGLQNKLETSLKISQQTTETYSKLIVFSGFRNKDYEVKLKNYNIKVVPTLNKNTSLLVIANEKSISSKIKLAEELNIPIITLEEFIKCYKL